MRVFIFFLYSSNCNLISSTSTIVSSFAFCFASAVIAAFVAFIFSSYSSSSFTFSFFNSSSFDFIIFSLSTTSFSFISFSSTWVLSFSRSVSYFSVINFSVSSLVFFSTSAICCLRRSLTVTWIPLSRAAKSLSFLLSSSSRAVSSLSLLSFSETWFLRSFKSVSYLSVMDLVVSPLNFFSRTFSFCSYSSWYYFFRSLSILIINACVSWMSLPHSGQVINWPFSFAFILYPSILIY